MINKKAIGHIEVIISFIIFIGFVLFLLTFLNPIKNKEVSQSILDFAERGILTEAGIEYNYTSIVLKEGIDFQTFGCFEINFDTGKIIIKDENENKVEAISQGGKIKVKLSDNINNGYYKFYSIYSAEELLDGIDPGSCLALEDTKYSIGLLRKNKVLSYSKLMELNSRYYNNYDELKINFKIPDSNDFGFVITSATGGEIINAMKNKPAKISIISRDTPSQILNKTGDINYVVMNVRAW